MDLQLIFTEIKYRKNIVGFYIENILSFKNFLEGFLKYKDRCLKIIVCWGDAVIKNAHHFFKKSSTLGKEVQLLIKNLVKIEVYFIGIKFIGWRNSEDARHIFKKNLLFYLIPCWKIFPDNF